MRSVLDDLRYGFRVLRNSPGSTAVAVLTLALGIAATSTVFSWMDAVLFHPLPGVEENERLAVVESVTRGGEFLTTSLVEYRHYRDNLTLISGLAAAHPDTFVIGDAENGERVWGELVSSNYFAVLGVKPVLGRVFRPQEFGDSPGAYPLVVISERLWRGHFLGIPDIVGKTLRLNRQQLTVVGVAPRDFKGMINGLVFDVWAPLTMSAEFSVMNEAAFQKRGSRGFNCVARLRSGVSTAQAQAEAHAAAMRLDAIAPDTARGIGVLISPLWKAHYGAANLLYRPLQILMVVSVMVLLIVCANVANLLLVRSASRRKEFALRFAAGATGARLGRQLLTETLILAGAGTLLALLLGVWMQDWLVRLVPGIGLPISVATQLNLRVLGFTVLMCVVATVGSGLAPALSVRLCSVNETLKDSGRSGASGVATHRTRGLLVISEVALAALALIGAGLFVKSFRNTTTIDLGFEAKNVLLARFYPSTGGYSEPQALEFCRRLRGRLEIAPGIMGATYADSAPLGFEGTAFQEIVVEGYVPGPAEDMKIHRRLIAPGFFQLMRIPLIDGRDFTDGDDSTAPPVMIVTDSFARRYFPRTHAIGRRVRVETKWFTIVGIARDSKQETLAEAPQPFFYLPFDQFFNTGLGVSFFVRTPGDPSEAVATLRREAASIDPRIAGFHAVPLSEYTSASRYPQKVAAALLSALAALALLLAAVGLYSVVAYAVSQRTHELGIRMALGARPGDLIRMILRQAMAMALIGVVFGTAAAFAATRVVASMLVNVSAADPLTFLAALSLLCSVALLAGYLPARRATKVDPIVALRCE